MDIGLSQDQELFRATTQRFLETECPVTRVRDLQHDPSGFDPRYWRAGAELGWTSLLVSEKDGGGSISGDGIADLKIVAEEMGRLVSPGPLIPVNIVASTISSRGTQEQRAFLLPGILDGSKIATWAHAEVGMRWDASRVATVITAHDNGLFLNGKKIHVEFGAQADYLLVTARMGQEIIQLVIDAHLPGVVVTPVDTIDLVRRFSTVSFEGVEVSSTMFIGDSDLTGDDIDRQLMIGVLLQCAETCGSMQKVLDFTLEYLGDRYLFGRALAGYQALKHRCADWRMKLEACHGITTVASHALSTSASNAPELVSAAKSYVGSISTELIQDCVQLHGGIGVTWEHDIHLYLRRATLNRGMYGSPVEHRERIGKFLNLSKKASARN
jgi:alkylation response protein AidB-like acyl-CoA dehydrogenase